MARISETKKTSKRSSIEWSVASTSLSLTKMRLNAKDRPLKKRTKMNAVKHLTSKKNVTMTLWPRESRVLRKENLWCSKFTCRRWETRPKRQELMRSAMPWRLHCKGTSAIWWTVTLTATRWETTWLPLGRLSYLKTCNLKKSRKVRPRKSARS